MSVTEVFSSSFAEDASAHVKSSGMRSGVEKIYKKTPVKAKLTYRESENGRVSSSINFTTTIARRVDNEIVQHAAEYL